MILCLLYIMCSNIVVFYYDIMFIKLISLLLLLLPLLFLLSLLLYCRITGLFLLSLANKRVHRL